MTIDPDYVEQPASLLQLREALQRIAELEGLEHEWILALEDLHLHQEELRAQNEDLRQTQQELVATRQRYQDLFDFAPIGHFLLDATSAILEANHCAGLMLSMDRRALIGRLLSLHLINPHDRELLLMYLRMLANGAQPNPLEVTLTSSGGPGPRVELHGVCGNPEGTLLRLSMVDISHRHALHIEREKAENDRRLAAAVFEESNEGIIITDTHGRILRVNRAFTLVTGYAESEALSKTPGLLSSGRHDPSFYHVLWKHLQERGHWQGEIWNRRKNGEIYAEWLGISTIRDAQGQPQFYVGMFSDITEKKQNQLRIEQFAYFDTLTGLPNRTLFNDRLKGAMVRAHRHQRHVALLFLDLDRFKTINDTLGHQSGDLLLQVTAERLQSTVRASDTVARLGGDEFTIILADLENLEQALTSASTIADKILHELTRPFHLGRQEVHSGTSIGVAIYPGDGATLSDLVKHADTAMYHAKALGGGTAAFFSQEMNQRAMRRLTLDHHLRKAVAQERLTIHYQPIVDPERLEMPGVEALLRWQDEELGQVPPVEFVRALEELGLMSQVTDWMFEQIGEQLHWWAEQGLDNFHVAINISPRLFRDREYAQQIYRLLELARIRSQRIVLEITETHMMERPAEAREILLNLRNWGVRVGMDDFGTGYSSLSMLGRYPVDFIKIDGSFVRNMTECANDATLVDAIVGLADKLSLELVAEGVELPTQAQMLRSMGCRYMQGYLYAHPMAPARLPAWFKRFRGGAGPEIALPV